MVGRGHRIAMHWFVDRIFSSHVARYANDVRLCDLFDNRPISVRLAIFVPFTFGDW
jgi:hypothetical protein